VAPNTPVASATRGGGGGATKPPTQAGGTTAPPRSNVTPIRGGGGTGASRGGGGGAARPPTSRGGFTSEEIQAERAETVEGQRSDASRAADKTTDPLSDKPLKSVKRPPGAQPPQAAEGGNWVHANYDQIVDTIGPEAEQLVDDPFPAGSQLAKEVEVPDPRLPPGTRPRMDRVDYNKGIVYEIKPEHLRAQGAAEAKAYAEQMDRFEPLSGGRKWGYEVKTYNADKVIAYLKRIGYFAP
jgi:hypothetical protein